MPNTYDPGLTPDVWYGQVRGSVASSSGNSTSFTSPPGAAPGPVNLKLIYPDGEEGFVPQGFTYSTYPQYSILSGASPSGGVPGQLSVFGLTPDGSGTSLTVGGTTTTVIPPANPTNISPAPTLLNYTIPAGNPGWADLTVTTPNGTGSLPKSVFYAKSVTDYSSPDTFSAVLYDRKRNQVYLSANDHIDVFSVSSLEFVTALRPQVLGAQSQFGGLAMTPDGSQLLAANILDGSLAVINPDSPSSTFAVHVAALSGVNNCTVGPLYVAATSNGNAFVVTGSTPNTPGCPIEGNVYIVNIATKTVASTSGIAACNLFESYPFTTTLGVDSRLDGSIVVMGSGTYGSACLYSVASNTYAPIAGASSSFSASISPDGNIVGTGVVLGDPSSDTTVGRLAHPATFYGANLNTYSENALPTNALLNPRFNDSGSLYYWAFPNDFEIVDVPTGRLRIRFSLSETIQNVAAPLALDAGHNVFLITDRGLTVVDLGNAPLSIGHLSTNNASAGSQIQVRGSGFTAGISVRVGGAVAPSTFTDENTLTFTVPSVGTGVQDLTLANQDGDSYTLQNAVIIQ